MRVVSFAATLLDAVFGPVLPDNQATDTQFNFCS